MADPLADPIRGPRNPYHRAGLRLNPFAHDAVPPHSPDWVERGLPPEPAPGGRVLRQVIGVKGAGKTSSLRRWHASTGGPWRYVPPGRGRLRPLPVAPLVYWDEADRALPALRRLALGAAARSGATVVAGTHVDLAAEAGAAGLRVETIALPPITPAELRRWAEARFAAVALTQPWTLPDDVALAVAAEAGGSWRTAGDLLHVWVAEQL
jgi:hypothetical protein